ncbi:MAG: molybdenum cofactor guanylyltransferase [Gammaproteobacteria bacterium]|nr:MAG: molybdenum cofactor guanylyltransferase [Gammaproteobacteria bacterium]
MNTSSVATTDITAVILAGGRGRRMYGQDKGLMMLQNRPMIEHVLKTIEPQVGKMIISANRNQERYQELEFDTEVLSDEPLDGGDEDKYLGPLAGIATALKHISTPYLLCVPCDTPDLPGDLVQQLWTQMQQKESDVTVVRDDDRMHPTICLMKREVLPGIEKYLARGERKMEFWVRDLRFSEADFSKQTGSLTNINTPFDKEQHSY